VSGLTLDCLVCGAAMGEELTCAACGWTDQSPSANVTFVGQVLDHHDSHADNARVTQAADSTLSQTSPSDGSQSSSVMSESEICWEVWTVLAVGVIPYLPSILSHEYTRNLSTPYWIDFLSLVVNSATVTFVTLYLIHRSGEPFERFGIHPFQTSDLFRGIIFAMAAWISYVCWWELTAGIGCSTDDLFPVPRSRFDFVLMVIGYGVAGLSEEVITRAYLITRLEQLLKSRFGAVLLAGALFASYHLYQGVGGAFHALLFGLTYGAAFVWIRSVWPLAIGHAFINIYFELESLRTREWGH